MSVVTRYAPSPTGALHIGGARTALFNWAFARHQGGRFLLRFEDTDRARSTRESEKAVLEAMAWLGLDYDPVPNFAEIPRQSERLNRYQETIAVLLDADAAYRCTCTPDQIEAMRQAARETGRTPRYDGTCRERRFGPDPGRPFCVRLRVSEGGHTRWHDCIAGASGQDLAELDDFVIARSDGSPIYHLAVVVDDHDMGVTHVIRGREHMTSTPRQLLLYRALDFEPPQFAHVPLLVEPGGKKLSKRQASVSVQSYRDRGFTPEAVLNFIARLGWAHGDLEIFTREEFCKLFSFDGVGRSPSQVHDDKLLWISQQYLKTLPMDALLSHLNRFLETEAGGPVTVDAGLRRLIDLLRERSKTLIEMAQLARFYLTDEIEIDPKAASKHLKGTIATPLRELREAFGALADWTQASLQEAFHAVTERHGLKLAQLAQPVRVAIVGRPVSPGLFETLEILGRARSLSRIDAALAQIDATSQH
jgi:glutamyl-tRNA synthetase